MQSWPVLAEPAAPSGERMDLEAWVALPEDVAGELVDGRLTEEEVPDFVHEVAVAWLMQLFQSWLGDRGFVVGSEAKFIVRSTRGRKPDLSVFFPESRPPPRRGPARLPPDIMVEVVSPSPSDERRDRVDKMDDYAAFGVCYYWLVDPALGSLEVFELVDGRFTRALAMTSGVTLEVPGCRGLSLDVDALWARLARLGPDDQP